jgi:hypothetical protein
VINRNPNLHLTEAGREQLAILELVRGLRSVAATAEHAPDCRALRALALGALRNASVWIELPEVEP